MKALFLDFDGVMNSAKWFHDNQEAIKKSTTLLTRAVSELDPVAVARVKRIVDETGAKVVISSSWRLLYDLDELKAFLVGAGWPDPPIIDRTPRDDKLRSIRGDEVEYWLNNHPEVTAYVILDDDSDFYDDQRLVKTSWGAGINDDHVLLAINFLGKLDAVG